MERGGLGVYLVHTLVDRVEYGRQGRRNIIVLTKRMSQSSRVG
jgi:anti-sigma regulatory factor (Ser/Thr protein kinase)